MTPHCGRVLESTFCTPDGVGLHTTPTRISGRVNFSSLPNIVLSQCSRYSSGSLAIRSYHWQVLVLCSGVHTVMACTMQLLGCVILLSWHMSSCGAKSSTLWPIVHWQHQMVRWRPNDMMFSWLCWICQWVGVYIGRSNWCPNTWIAHGLGSINHASKNRLCTLPWYCGVLLMVGR